MGKIPGFYKGQMRECVICGYFYGELSGKIIKKDGKWLCVKTCVDDLTEAERAEQIIRR